MITSAESSISRCVSLGAEGRWFESRHPDWREKPLKVSNEAALRGFLYIQTHRSAQTGAAVCELLVLPTGNGRKQRITFAVKTNERRE